MTNRYKKKNLKYAKTCKAKLPVHMLSHIIDNIIYYLETEQRVALNTSWILCISARTDEP